MRAAFPIRDLYIAAIDEAEHSILLTTAYFVPDHMLVNALKDAVSRGVDVRVLVPWQSNHVLADWIAHSYFTDCLQGGIRIFGYRYTMLPHCLTENGSSNFLVKRPIGWNSRKVFARPFLAEAREAQFFS